MFFLPCFEKSKVFGYIGKKTQCNAAQTYDSHVSMLDRWGSYLYKLFNFTGINMKFINAVTNIE